MWGRFDLRLGHMPRVVLAGVMMLMIAGVPWGGCGEAEPPRMSTQGRVIALTPAAPLAQFSEKGTTLVFTPDGKPAQAAGPVLVVVRSSKVFDSDETRQGGPAVFINDLPDVRGASSFVTSAFAAGGLTGYATECDATKDQQKVRVYCAKLYASDGSHTLFGYAPADDAVGFAAIKATAASLVVR